MVRLVELELAGASAIDIASSVDAHPDTVRYAVMRIRLEGWICRRYYKEECICCGFDFFARGHRAKICSPRCRAKLDAERHHLRRQLDTRRLPDRHHTPTDGDRRKATTSGSSVAKTSTRSSVGNSPRAVNARKPTGTRKRWPPRAVPPLASSKLDAGRRRSRAWVQQESAAGRLDDFGQLIFDWMADSGLSISEAAETLGLEPKILRRLCCPWLRHDPMGKPWGFSRATIADLAARLGAVGARQWHAERWERELLGRHPKSLMDGLAVNANAMLGGRDEKLGRFAHALARRISKGGYTREAAATIVQTKPETLSTWLTRGRRKAAVPDPATVARVAWLWPGTDDQARYETVVRRLCLVAGGRGRPKAPSPAGLLVLRRLAELHLTMSAIYPRFVHDRDLWALVWKGRATLTTVLRVANALRLSDKDAQELELRCATEDKRTTQEMHTQRLKTRKRRDTLSAGRSEGHQKRSAEARLKVESAYQALVDEGKRPTRYQVAKRAECDPHTVNRYWPSKTGPL
jgi:hypothetical protein